MKPCWDADREREAWPALVLVSEVMLALFRRFGSVFKVLRG